MAKRNGRVESRKPDGGSGSFVLVDLDDDQRSEFAVWSEGKVPDFSDVGSELCERGWKLSFSYSVHYGCYFGSLTGKETGTRYDGVTVSTRHTDLNKLLLILRFVGSVLCPDDRISLPDQGSRFSW